MVINVTQDHIDHGIPHDCQGCAIGLALYEQLHLPPLDITTLEYIFDNLLPEHAIAWMVLFDTGAKVMPFSFEIDETSLELASVDWHDLAQEHPIEPTPSNTSPIIGD